MKKALVIIEEDLFLGNVIEERIKKEGFETSSIHNAGASIDKMQEFKPDIVVMDMELKTTSPFKILEEKNRKPGLKNIPVIIISAAGDVKEIRRALDLGVKDYVVKSQFDAQELIIKINNQISGGSGKNIGSLENKKVMWVEDDQFLSDLIARKLSQHKSKLIFTRTGEDALKTLEKETPDVILLDLLLPGISGFEVLKAIKSNERIKNVPVIILSNFTQNNEIEKTRAMGADRFLTKATVVLDDIVKEILSVLKGK